MHYLPPLPINKSLRRVDHFTHGNFAKSRVKAITGLTVLSLDLHIIQYTQQGETSSAYLHKILLQNAKTLKSLTLSFPSNTPQTLKAFIFALKHLQNLHILSLDFSNCQEVNDSILKDLSSSLSCCSGLESLHIKLCYSLNISYTGRKYLYKTLKSLNNVKDISLDFRYSANIINKDLISLSKALQRCPNVAALRLAWAGCKRIEASGVRYLSGSMGKLKNLKRLSLGLVDTPSVTDQELEELSKGFNKMKALESIELNFKQKLGGIVRQEDWTMVDYRKISDRGMQALLNVLKENKGLLTLLLNFKECYQVGEKMMKALVKILKECVCLKKVKLNFGCQGNVNNEVIEGFCRDLDGLNVISSHVDLGVCKNAGAKKRTSLFKVTGRNLAVQGTSQTECF